MTITLDRKSRSHSTGTRNVLGGFKWSSQHGLCDWIGGTGPEPRPVSSSPNENTNGLLRQYFPKGTDLSAHSAEDLTAVAIALAALPGAVRVAEVDLKTGVDPQAGML